MKNKTILNVLLGVCATLLLTNCGGGSDNEGPTLSVQPPVSITLEADGVGKTVTVSSNTSWTVRADDSWAMCSPSGGDGGANVTISASINDTGRERSTTIRFTDKTGRATASINVTQKAGGTPSTSSLEVSKNNLSFKATGGSDSFKISSNTSWTVSSDQSWCTVNTTSGSNDGTINVTVTENKGTTARSATITVKYENKSVTITVSQEADNVQLTVSPTSISFTENAGSESISISSNTDWTVSSNQSWCTVSPASGNSNGTVTISVSANDSTSERSATVTIKDASGSVTHSVSVTQAAKPKDDEIGRDDYGDDTNLDKNK